MQVITRLLRGRFGASDHAAYLALWRSSTPTGAFRVEPICRVLTEHGVKIAESSYHAAKTRPLSAQAIRDAQLPVEIRRRHGDPAIGRAYREPARCGISRGSASRWPECTVERLMLAAGLQGAVRGQAARHHQA
jgi:putative transposase